MREGFVHRNRKTRYIHGMRTYLMLSGEGASKKALKYGMNTWTEW